MSLGFLGTDQGFEIFKEGIFCKYIRGVNTSKSSNQQAFLLTTTHSYETDYTWGLKGDVLTSAHKGKNAIMQELANIQRNYNYFRV